MSKHDSELGNLHAHALFDRIWIAKKEAVEIPWNFSDYRVTLNDHDWPAGVTLIRRLG